MFNNVKGKVYSIPQILFSSSSSNYDHNYRHHFPLKIYLPKFDGQLNIKEFLDWFVEAERFFEHTKIAEVKNFKLGVHKLKGKAYALWEQLQMIRTQLRKDPIETWKNMKKYLKE